MSEIPDSTEVDIRTVTTSPSRTSTCASSKARSEGRELPMHSHPPRAVIAIGAYRMRSVDADGTITIIDRRPGEATWSAGEEPQRTRADSGRCMAIEVEVKRYRRHRFTPTPAGGVSAPTIPTRLPSGSPNIRDS